MRVDTGRGRRITLGGEGCARAVTGTTCLIGRGRQGEWLRMERIIQRKVIFINREDRG
jgi:hypothetical protein